MMASFLKTFAATILVLIVFWLSGLLWFVTLIPHAAVEDTGRTDAIVVLTGGALRLERGFALLLAGRADKLFISGVEDGLTLPALLHRKEFQPFAYKITADRVTLGYLARTTIGNAEETARWATREQIKSLRLVTGSYHMPRGIYELKATMPGIVIVPEPVFPSHFAHNRWWQFGGSIRLVVSEYNKFLASVIVNTLLVPTL